tara:strand:+ start:9191 stop:10336 length:1146 start_codon:yes stop_codon:yes gene_type:complete
MFFYFGAMQATTLARPVLAFELADRAPIVLGIVIAANNAPSLVLSPFAGALADRMSMRNILMGAALLMTFFAVITAVGIGYQVLSWWHVTLIGVFQGSVMVFITPTRRAIIGGLVDRPLLLNATGLHTMSQNTNRMLMPLVAGLLFTYSGPEWSFVLIAALYVLAIFLLFFVPVYGSFSSSVRKRGGSALDGFRYVKQEPIMRNLLLVGLVITVFGQPFQHLLPLAQEFLHIQADGVGLLFTFFGIGSLLGSTVSASLGDFQRKGLLLIAFFMLFGFGVVCFALSEWFWLSLLIMIPIGIGQSGRTVVHLATLQSYSEDEMRGRVQALNAMMGGLIPFAVLGITTIAEIFNGRIALSLAGGIILIYGLWELIFSKTLRELR